MTTLRVFVTHKLAEPLRKRLEAAAHVECFAEDRPPSREELTRGAAGADGLLCLLTDRVDRDLLQAAPELSVLSSVSVGVDHIDLAAATERRVPVGHTPFVLVETTADFAFALLFAVARRVAEADAFVRDGSWTPDKRWSPTLLLGRDIHGAVLGVVGLGPIGQAVARRAAAFGMRVLGWSRTPRALPFVESVPFDELCAEADYVSVHVALTSETRGLFDARAIGRMKPGSILINTARGGIVDEAALALALREGRLAGAGLDVFAREPIERESPLLSLRQVVLAPHIGSATVATRMRMAELAVENLLAGLRGERMPHCANAAVYEARPPPRPL